MKTLEESRKRFAEIMDTLAEAAVQSPNLDAELLTRTATSESQNLAELERGLRAMRTSFQNGVSVFAPDFEALAEFAQVNDLILGEIQPLDVDEASGRITFFECSGSPISDLEQLSCLTSLKELHLQKNRIQDISALAGLTSLNLLCLNYNQIQDLSALSGMTSLKNLQLYGNQIQDISALSGLTTLTSLDLSGNQIHDISALSGLVSLNVLCLERNHIQDISRLTGLTSLRFLNINKPKNLEKAAAVKFDDQIAALRHRGVKVRV